MISRVRSRRICGAVLLWAAMVLGIAVARGEGLSTPPTGVLPITAAADCILGPLCPPTPSDVTPTPRPPTPSPKTTPTGTPTVPATPAPPRPSTSPPSSLVPRPVPTLRPDTQTPSAPPAVSGLQVQTVSLAVASGDTVRTGVNVLVQATCSAHRGADVYSVPHAKVTFQVAGPPGSTPAVTPTQVDAGDTGIATVSVVVGDVPGDIQLTATSGSITGTTTIHVTGDQPTPTPTPTATPAAVAALPGSIRVVDSGGTTGGRAVAVAGLVALGAAILTTTVLRIGVLPRLAARRPQKAAVHAEGQGGEAGQQPV